MSLTPIVVKIFFSAEKHNKVTKTAIKIAYNHTRIHCVTRIRNMASLLFDCITIFENSG